MKIPRLDLSIGILLALFVFITHALSPVSQPYDSRWTVHTATSLLHQGNFDLDEYLPLLEADGFYHIECVFPDGSRIRRIRQASDCAGGHFYHFYPLGVPVMTAPIVASLEIGLHAMQPWLGDWADRHLGSGVQKPFFHGDLIASPDDGVAHGVLSDCARHGAFLLAIARLASPAFLGAVGAAIRLRKPGLVHRQPCALDARVLHASAHARLAAASNWAERRNLAVDRGRRGVLFRGLRAAHESGSACDGGPMDSLAIP